MTDSKPKIYLDLDNTLADFSLSTPEEVALLKMHHEGYFRNLKPVKGARTFVEMLQRIGFPVYILTKCIPTEHCKEEKRIWVKQHLPTIPEHNVFVLEVGDCKTIVAESVAGDILVDDFSENCRSWERAGGIAIKIVLRKRKTTFKGIVVHSLREAFAEILKMQVLSEE